MNIRYLAIVAATVGLAAACGSSSDVGSSSSAPTPTAASSSPAPTAALVKSSTGTVGGKSTTLLVDGRGMTLYYFMPDKGGKVTCVGGCASVWPAVVVPSGATAPGSVSGFSGPFGTVTNPAGGTQLTYNSWPLYTYASDKAPGDANGQGTGGKWFVVTPDVPSGATASAPSSAGNHY